MGWLADRIGVRRVAAFGIVMVCGGLMVAASGDLWRFYLAYAFLVGLLGHACLFAPLQVYVTR
jgi:MFS family permease